MKIETCDITMAQGIGLIKLYKVRTKKVKQTVPDDEKNKGKDPKKDIMVLKTIDEKVLYNIQTVEIVAINKLGQGGNQYEVGDVVLLDWRKVKDFDLYNNVKSINLYDIIGKVNF